MSRSILSTLSPLLLTLVLACPKTDTGDEPQDTAPEDTAAEDQDGDGSIDALDCDDADASIFPGAPEACNAFDDDCDGLIDEDVTTRYYTTDADGDGHYDPDGAFTDACEETEGSPDATDCDDTRADVNPEAAEVCDDADNDCDGTTDEDVKSLFYADSDGDGYGNPLSSTLACAAPTGHVSDATDCDDLDATVNPGIVEVCDGRDDDCDGAIDDDLRIAVFDDADGDGWGDADAGSLACTLATGQVEDSTDCDDTRADVSPGAAESCDLVDNDCDGVVDEDVLVTWYADVDGDGFGNALYDLAACEAPLGFVGDGTDCDDLDAGIHPGAEESCDGVDQDCDGELDPATCGE